MNLAILANQQGDYARARRLTEDALTTYRALVDRQATATALVALANAARGEGARAEANALHAEALGLFRAVEHQPGIVAALTHLAVASLDEGDLASARARLVESLRLVQGTGDLPAVAACLTAAARLAAASERWEAATHCGAAAMALRAKLGIPVPASEEEAWRRIQVAGHAALGAPAVAEAVEAGRTSVPEQAIAEALASCAGPT